MVCVGEGICLDTLWGGSLLRRLSDYPEGIDTGVGISGPFIGLSAYYGQGWPQ